MNYSSWTCSKSGLPIMAYSTWGEILGRKGSEVLLIQQDKDAIKGMYGGKKDINGKSIENEMANGGKLVLASFYKDESYQSLKKSKIEPGQGHYHNEVFILELFKRALLKTIISTQYIERFAEYEKLIEAGDRHFLKNNNFENNAHSEINEAEDHHKLVIEVACDTVMKAWTKNLPAKIKDWRSSILSGRKYQVETSLDNSTIWVNSKDGICVARFSKSTGAFVNNSAASQISGAQESLYATHDQTTKSDWLHFCDGVKKHHGIIIDKNIVQYETHAKTNSKKYIDKTVSPKIKNKSISNVF
jgi:hypothetical protein